MHSERKDASRSGRRRPPGKALQRATGWHAASQAATAANYTSPGQRALLRKECLPIPPGLAPRGLLLAVIAYKSIPIFKKSYEHYHVIKFPRHLKTLSFWVLLCIYSLPYLSKDKEVEWRKSVLYYPLNSVKSKRKVYQEKKRLWLLYGIL